MLSRQGLSGWEEPIDGCAVGHPGETRFLMVMHAHATVVNEAIDSGCSHFHQSRSLKVSGSLVGLLQRRCRYTVHHSSSLAPIQNARQDHTGVRWRRGLVEKTGRRGTCHIWLRSHEFVPPRRTYVGIYNSVCLLSLSCLRAFVLQCHAGSAKAWGGRVKVARRLFLSSRHPGERAMTPP
jgi:hypothetical protein